MTAATTMTTTTTTTTKTMTITKTRCRTIVYNINARIRKCARNSAVWTKHRVHKPSISHAKDDRFFYVQFRFLVAPLLVVTSRLLLIVYLFGISKFCNFEPFSSSIESRLTFTTREFSGSGRGDCVRSIS
jgi:hypothetical protein